MATRDAGPKKGGGAGGGGAPSPLATATYIGLILLGCGANNFFLELMIQCVPRQSQWSRGDLARR